jgi:hypothetical protein
VLHLSYSGFLESPVEARAAQCTNRILLYSISRMEEYVDNSESGRVGWFKTYIVAISFMPVETAVVKDIFKCLFWTAHPFRRPFMKKCQLI